MIDRAAHQIVKQVCATPPVHLYGSITIYVDESTGLLKGEKSRHGEESHQSGRVVRSLSAGLGKLRKTMSVTAKALVKEPVYDQMRNRNSKYFI